MVKCDSREYHANSTWKISTEFTAEKRSISLGEGEISQQFFRGKILPFSGDHNTLIEEETKWRSYQNIFLGINGSLNTQEIENWATEWMGRPSGSFPGL